MTKQILSVISILFIITSCSGVKTKRISQDSKKFESIKNQVQANKMNSAIEEVEVSDRVFFNFDSHSLTEDARKTLNVQVEWLNSEKSIDVLIEGHCDERGTREYNVALGARRASAVKNFLVKNGIKKSRIKTISYGKERPALVGSSRIIWSKNRRAVTISK